MTLVGGMVGIAARSRGASGASLLYELEGYDPVCSRGGGRAGAGGARGGYMPALGRRGWIRCRRCGASEGAGEKGER